MLKTALLEIFERDLRRVAEEIGLYRDEANLWVTQAHINNSAGTLCLHLIGNLQHFIGAVLGHTGYVRQRDLEFSLKDVPRAELLRGLEETAQAVSSALQHLPEHAFSDTYPVPKRDQIVQTDFMLLHLLGHLSYHLGQISYHRRLLDA
ncbi:MAG TPA: DinB family protein [Saprospiraceae bacterium]|nr:DinB family protein [Saprospiraceae bacterium]HND87111.1 DinB family protein [Saprospiraceae bacterium]